MKLNAVNPQRTPLPLGQARFSASQSYVQPQFGSINEPTWPKAFRIISFVGLLCITGCMTAITYQGNKFAKENTKHFQDMLQSAKNIEKTMKEMEQESKGRVAKRSKQ